MGDVKDNWEVAFGRIETVDHLNKKPVDPIIDTGASVITGDNLGTPEIEQLLK